MNTIFHLPTLSFATVLRGLMLFSLLLMSLIFWSFKAKAAAPANDEPGGAISLTLGVAASGTLVDATDSGYDYCFDGINDEDDDVWYSFTAPSSGNIDVAFSNISGATQVTYVSILSGLTGISNCVRDFDDGGGSETGLTAGNTYYLQVYSLNSTAQSTTFNITVSESVPPPVNNSCAGSVTITPDGATASGTLVGATASGINGCSSHNSDADDDVWFQFTPSATTQAIEVLRTGGSNPGLQYTVHSSTGPCAGLAVVNCSNSTSITLTGLNTNATYYLQVYSFLEATHTTTFSVRIVSTPSNDECSNAVGLTAGASVAGSTLGATKNDTDTGCDFGRGLWYSFVGTGGNLTVSALQTDGTSDLAMALVSNSCGSFVEEACVDNVVGVGNESLTFLSLADETYYVYVAHWNPSGSNVVNYNMQIFEAVVPNVAVSSGCSAAGSVTLTGSDNWLPIYAGASLVGKIHDTEALGVTSFNLYGHAGGSLRTSGQPYADRNITISPSSQPSTTISVRLYFTASEITDLIASDPSVSSISDMRFAKVSGTSCSAAFSNGAGVQYLTPSSTGDYGSDHYLQFSVASFSEFYLTSSAAPLPAELVHLEAFAKTTGNLIEWQTASEMNVAYFEVERSLNGVDFVTAGQREAVGNSDEIQYYDFLDLESSEKVYYRIVTVDFDGAKEESELVVLERSPDQKKVELQVFPNPARDLVTLNSTGKGQVILTNVSGQRVLEVDFDGQASHQFEVSHLPRGQYIVTQVTGERVVSTWLVLK